MQLSDLFSETKTITLDMGKEQTLNLQYLPNAITPEFISQATSVVVESYGEGAIGAIKANEAASTLTARMVSEIVKSWDLTDNEMQPFPPTLENLKKVPLEVLKRILNECKADAIPNAQRRNS